MTGFRTSALILALTAATTAPVSAQVLGLPVENAGIVSGLGLAIDGGLPNDEAGGGHAFGATAALGFGPLGVTARVSRYSPDVADPLWSAGATLNYKVFGGPLVPIAATLQAGAGYAWGP